MKREIKTFSGLMNLDDSNEIMPNNHHKEARNGVFRGNDGMMKFQAIRGNIKITNSNLKINDRV
jgi:hypothetical protein